jgi:hypothetical protein
MLREAHQQSRGSNGQSPSLGVGEKGEVRDINEKGDTSEKGEK